MTNEEKQQHLTNIVAGIDEIQAETDEVTYDDFINEEQIKESVYMKLQMIGQAAYQLSLGVNKEDLNFDPKILANLRNARYNQEAEINHANVWYIITNDLMQIKDTIREEAARVDTSS